jgi:hypothetical protein
MNPVKHGPHSRQTNASTRPRDCLRCDRRFASEGPHHRLCQTCREWVDETPTPEPVYSLSGER